MIDVKKPRSRVLGRIELCGLSRKDTYTENEKHHILDKSQVPQIGQKPGAADWTRT